LFSFFLLQVTPAVVSLSLLVTVQGCLCQVCPTAMPSLLCVSACAVLCCAATGDPDWKLLDIDDALFGGAGGECACLYSSK